MKRIVDRASHTFNMGACTFVPSIKSNFSRFTIAFSAFDEVPYMVAYSTKLTET